MTGPIPLAGDAQEETLTETCAALGVMSVDEARHPERIPLPSKAASSLDASILQPESVPTSGEQSRAGSNGQSSSHLDPAASTSSFLLTLKPSRSRREQDPSAAGEISFDPDQTTTTDADDDPRRATPSKRTDPHDPSNEQTPSSARKHRERRGHHAPPPPRTAQPVFTTLVLPHARVPRAPISGTLSSSSPVDQQNSPLPQPCTFPISRRRDIHRPKHYVRIRARWWETSCTSLADVTSTAVGPAWQCSTLVSDPQRFRDALVDADPPTGQRHIRGARCRRGERRCPP